MRCECPDACFSNKRIVRNKLKLGDEARLKCVYFVFLFCLFYTLLVIVLAQGIFFILFTQSDSKFEGNI